MINLFEFCSLTAQMQYEISGFSCLVKNQKNHTKENLRKLQFLCYTFYFRKKLIK